MLGKFQSFLADAAASPAWVVSSFPIIRIVLMAIIALCAICLIVVTLMQNTEGGGNNAISGVQESYYAQNKGATRQGVLKKITIAMASIIAICIILFFVTLIVYKGY